MNVTSASSPGIANMTIDLSPRRAPPTRGRCPQPATSRRGCRGAAAFVAASLAAGCAPAKHPRYDYSAEPDPRKLEYVIGASDALHVSVWKNPELSTDAKVRPDGTITMPLLGDISVAGRTPSAVKQELARRLAQFIKDDAATVTVSVTEVNSYRFTIAGNVEHPGEFSSRHYVTVAEAIALAGGPNRYASADRMLVIRPPRGGAPGDVRRLPVDYSEIRAGEHPEQNLVIVPGDTVYVP